jgi:2',3'-cyclic-nucleotide 2'-phosphodiesterase (5'-nucleotidase family)
MSQRITILHTNDFHNHLTTGQAEALRRMKVGGGANTLLVDSGDAISAGNIGVRPAGEPILTLMSDIGYDAMTMGNREFHISDPVLRHKIGNARFPILCANMRYRNSSETPERPLPTAPYLSRTLGSGLRVGVIGVTVPMVTERMTARHISSFLFDDPIAVTSRMVAELRGKVDLLFALTHIGIKADEQLSRACPELDLIVSGHTHLTIAAGERGSGVPIVQAGWFGRQYGIVEFDLESDRPRLVRSSIMSLEQAQT